MGGIKINRDFGTNDHYGDAEHLKYRLFMHFTNKDIENEYKELLDEILLIFKNKDITTKYAFDKEASCFPCVNQKCKCSCLIHGRVRRLHIINNSDPHNFLEQFDRWTIRENSYDDITGYIQFLNNNVSLNLDTKLNWVLCNGIIKLGEFGDGPRELKCISKLPFSESPFPFNKIVKIIGG